MSTPGLLTAFLATIFWATSVFPFTKAGRVMTVESLNMLRLTAGTLLVLAAAIAFDRNFFSIFSSAYTRGWLWLGASGIVALGIGDYFGLKMYNILSPRYGSVLTTLSPAMALLMGIIFLNEQMNVVGLCGMGITITGVMTMSLGRTERNAIPDHGHGSVFTGIIFGIISAVCNGAALALSKKGFLEQSAQMNSLQPLTGSFIRFAVATIVVLLFMACGKRLLPNVKNIKSQRAGTLRTAATGVILGPLLGTGLSMAAIQHINVAVAQTIFALVPVVALIISHFVYKEKITRNALLGVLAAIAGVAILIWRMEITAVLS